MVPSIRYLNELFEADFEAGTLTWKVRPVSYFKDAAKQSAAYNANSWSSQNAGKAARFPSDRGYLLVRIDGRNYRSHRIIFAMAHAHWPEHHIDHINGVRDDNRIVNLRDVTNAENLRNQNRSHGGSSKFTGVCWHKYPQKWRAYIHIVGKRKHLGYFTNEIAAASAYHAAAEELGFTEGHIRAADGTLPPMPIQLSMGWAAE